jgi:hypothetical protein
MDEKIEMTPEMEYFFRKIKNITLGDSIHVSRT